jgi:hypothetical protein
MTELDLESEIRCRSLAIRSRNMSESEVKELLIATYRRLVELDAQYLPLIRKQWRIEL